MELTNCPRVSFVSSFHKLFRYSTDKVRESIKINPRVPSRLRADRDVSSKMAVVMFPRDLNRKTAFEPG
jgi:hypothetical protein